MENSSATAINSLSNYPNIFNFTKSDQPKQEEEVNFINSKPSKEKIDYLNKIGREYPFCAYHKHRNNDPL
jgi:hypothetical protein